MAGSVVATLPGIDEGFYVVTAKTQIDNGDNPAGATITCDLEVGDGTDVSAVSFPASGGSATIPLVLGAEVPAGGGAAILSCDGAAAVDPPRSTACAASHVGGHRGREAHRSGVPSSR